MNTTISSKQKKLVDLPVDVISVLSVQAAREGKSVKAYMEKLLIAAAQDLEDVTLYTVLSNTEPDGHIIVSELDKRAFEQKYGL